MLDNFYMAFEDKFRGSCELIKERLLIYKPFLDVLVQLDSTKAIDLGCGRGEWLEILSDMGLDALGVDLDLRMLEVCREKGLNVKQQDVIEALKTLEDASVSVISGFHIVEHLQFEMLQTLIQESLRVLKPGGLLILETPNPENIQVATTSFYLDPTHNRPIPSQLLSFLPQHYGFERTKVLRLQESKELLSLNIATLSDVISSVSKDYAVVAQKSTSHEALHKFNELFDKVYGLSLDDIMYKFEYRLLDIEQRATQAEQRATQAEQRATQAEQRATQAEQRATQAWEHYTTLTNSRSWKITKPLRIIGNIIRKILNLFPGLKMKFKKILVRNIDYSTMNESCQKDEILIDITHVFKNDLKTGIQRVVRSISKELQLNFDNAKLIYLTDSDGHWAYKYVDTPNKVVVPKHQDVFLGLDLNSAIIEANTAGLFSDWKARGVKIHFVVYDILPVLHPEWWEKGVSYAHETWLKTILTISDSLLCISNAVRSDVKIYLQNNIQNIKNTPDIHWFHLGADLENSLPTKGLPSNADSILDIIKSKKTFLMVGTIEPRKGHKHALATFDSLWKSGVDINLVIVGKKGWMVDEIIEKINKHPEFNNRLFWLESISDEYLDKVYSASSCLLAPSEGEGFGLPLIEAAQHKIPIIARDIPVFREIASDNAYYFENNNFGDTVAEWLDLNLKNLHPKSEYIPCLTWSQSAKKIIGVILDNNMSNVK